MKVKIMTQDYIQNLIDPLVVLKFDPKEPNCFKNARTCLRFHKKMLFLLHIILSASDNIQKLLNSFDFIFQDSHILQII